MESKLAADMEESDVEFRKQFDPKSETYHKGDLTPVPVGGERVPETMNTVYDKEYIKQVEESQNINYGPEYDTLMELRTKLGDLKKVLNQICPPIEAIMRIKSKETEKEKLDKLVQAEIEKLDKAVAEVRAYNELIAKTYMKEKYCAGLENVCKDAYKEFKDKEEFTDYGFIVKKYTSGIFNDQKELLEKIKKIKAQFTKETKKDEKTEN